MAVQATHDIQVASRRLSKHRPELALVQSLPSWLVHRKSAVASPRNKSARECITCHNAQEEDRPPCSKYHMPGYAALSHSHSWPQYPGLSAPRQMVSRVQGQPCSVRPLVTLDAGYSAFDH